MKFIRKNGRIIPIRDKNDSGSPVQRKTKKKMNTVYMKFGTKKTTFGSRFKSGASTGAKYGAGLGFLGGLASGSVGGIVASTVGNAVFGAAMVGGLNGALGARKRHTLRISSKPFRNSSAKRF